MITHIKFISIPVRDQDRALAFWTERVGFKVFTDQPFDDTQRWIELRVGSSDTGVVLFNFDSQGRQPGGTFNGAFECHDVVTTHAELAARGVEFVKPPAREHWGSFAVFKDPDGNEFLLSSR